MHPETPILITLAAFTVLSHAQSLWLEANGGSAGNISIDLSAGFSVENFPRCRCTPDDSCWPSEPIWEGLNTLLDGRVIKTSPVAQSCYDPGKSIDQCEYVAKMWSDQDFQTDNPVGRPYPYNITCPPIDLHAGDQPGSCSLGSLPVYAINATDRHHILAGLAFARLNGIRVTVASTGHDLLGRSDGYGSLEIWLRHYRNSINFQQAFHSATRCTESGWNGSAIHVDGAYQWRDVYEVAKANNVIAVGGGSVSPGATGGWSSGGGHGPATRNFGLGADQILEAEVMLADGRIVIANHCQNNDLFKALRGGGPGYGVVLGLTIKVYPDVDVVTVQHLAMAPFQKTPNNTDLLDAVATMIEAYPALNDAGYSGYGYWFRNFPRPFVGNATSGYTHGFWTIGKGREEADKAFAPVRELLSQYKDKLMIQETWKTYSDYWSFYDAESGLYDPAGDTSILTSRFIDRKAVSDHDRVRDTVEVMSGTDQEVTSNVVLLVSGGKVFEDAKDETSGLHPAWRTSSFVLIAGRGITKNATNEERRAVQNDVTFVKGRALKKLAPDTGGYMNEGDRHDPDHKASFYGSQYNSHLETKKKYDPLDVFYCPTCVGSEAFLDSSDGPLCRRE